MTDSSSSSNRSAPKPLQKGGAANLALTLERLREEIFDGFWRDLEPHAERSALFLVALDLDLASVGLAIAKDQAPQVAEWITSGELARPRPDQLAAWSQSPTHRFRLVIVAPYVLIQDLAN